jgi:hypothetical protein
MATGDHEKNKHPHVHSPRTGQRRPRADPAARKKKNVRLRPETGSTSDVEQYEYHKQNAKTNFSFKFNKITPDSQRSPSSLPHLIEN